MDLRFIIYPDRHRGSATVVDRREINGLGGDSGRPAGGKVCHRADRIGRADLIRDVPTWMIFSFLLKLQHRVTFIGKVKERCRLCAVAEALWLLNVLVIPQRRQTNPPQGHAGRVHVLRAVRGRQLLCKGATAEPLRLAKGGSIGAHRRHAASRQLIRFGPRTVIRPLPSHTGPSVFASSPVLPQPSDARPSLNRSRPWSLSS